MTSDNFYYKHSNSGNVIHHVVFWWTWKQKEPVKFSESYYSPLTDSVCIPGAPDLTGYVPISVRLYERIIKKNKRALKRPNLNNSVNYNQIQK